MLLLLALFLIVFLSSKLLYFQNKLKACVFICILLCFFKNFSWWFDFDRKEADKMLLLPGNTTGTFLVRESQGMLVVVEDRASQPEAERRALAVLWCGCVWVCVCVRACMCWVGKKGWCPCEKLQTAMQCNLTLEMCCAFSDFPSPHAVKFVLFLPSFSQQPKYNYWPRKLSTQARCP